MSVRLKDLAQQLNLSTSTVSKALKNYPDIGEETKKKVHELANSLDYHPNISALSLKVKETKTIGLIVPALVHYFFSKVIKGVIDTATKHNYLVIVLATEDTYNNEVKFLKKLMNRSVDGIILSLSDNTINFNHISDVIEKGTPVVLYDKISKRISASKVVINDITAAKQATEYLIKTGCKTIIHIGGMLRPQTTIDRLKGYRKAIEDNALGYDSKKVYVAENLTYMDGYQLVDTILNDHPNVDGIFCITDLIAVGVLKRLKELKIEIPKRISVVGFSNWFISEVSSPSLTTINQSGYEMGCTAFDLLLEEIKTKKEQKVFTPKTIEIPTQLILRDSTQ